VSGPTDGASYVAGTGPTPTCTATDAGSGMNGACVGVRTGGTAGGVGNFVYTATAKDLAGNVATMVVKYSVVYRFDGFAELPPKETVEVGEEIQFRFQARRADGTVVSSMAVPVWAAPVKVSATGAVIGLANPAGSVPVFAVSGKMWAGKWKTKGMTPGSYKVGVKLDDGTTRTITLTLRKS
jgi:large repetitive protein